MSLVRGQLRRLADGVRVLERRFKEVWELTGLGEVELPPQSDSPRMSSTSPRGWRSWVIGLGGSTARSSEPSRTAPGRWPSRRCSLRCRACGPAFPTSPWRRCCRASFRATSARRAIAPRSWWRAWRTPSHRRPLAILLLGKTSTQRPSSWTWRRGRTLASRASLSFLLLLLVLSMPVSACNELLLFC